MQVRSAVELIFNFAWRKTFVSNDDTFIDIVVSYECRVSTGINTVTRKYLCADRFHFFNIVCVYNRDVFCVFYSGFVREC